MRRLMLLPAAVLVASCSLAAGFTESVKMPGGEFVVMSPSADGWTFDLKLDTSVSGVDVLRIALSSDKDRQPPAFSVKTRLKLDGVRSVWSPHRGKARYSNHVTGTLPAEWMCKGPKGCVSETARWQPVYAFLDDDDNARCVFATSECEHHVRFEGGPSEKAFDLPLALRFFETTESPRRQYRTEVRLDRRSRKYWDAVREATLWQNAVNGYVPATVPDAAFAPLYSTWYNHHRAVDATTLDRELALAASLGMGAVILDDGWQVGRGYDECGDWNLDTRKFPDMRAHVAAAHRHGMKYVIWFGVPWAGPNTDVRRRHEKHLLPGRELGTGVLDPRFPEVRRELTDRFVRAIREWDVDGLKLDFIERFAIPEGKKDPAIAENFAGRDFRSLPEAVSCLMRDIYAACTAVKPGLLFEFRQPYVGPAILQAGNMVRVGDCPGDALANRTGIAALRLASVGASVHGDMVRWPLGEKPETAALHVLNAIFGVLQFSMVLKDCSAPTREMIAHWCRFSTQHRGALLRGAFRAHDAPMRYPLLEGEDAAERIIGVYSPRILADCGTLDKRIVVLNATGTDKLLLRIAGMPGTVRAFDTFGRGVSAPKLSAGLNEVALPVSGYLVFEPVSASKEDSHGTARGQVFSGQTQFRRPGTPLDNSLLPNFGSI